ncbi:MAG: alpha/beta hydrolase [Candidatus Pacebacteria bacterium]|jgi:predicted alpha/beta hydrolase family esterase|nr:alpha/beta hydrolase [Candidatus Paceibacterota bacterium]
MQSLLLLPGNSIRNKEWLSCMRNAFENDFHVSAIAYDHWTTLDQMDFSAEVEKIKNLNTRFDIVVAKSAGVALALLAVSKRYIQPEKMILLGTPLTAMLSDAEGAKLLHENMVPTVYIQQSHDPYCPFTEAKNTLEKLLKENDLLIKVEGNDHSYNTPLEIKPFLH